MTKTGLKLPYEDSKIAIFLRKTIDALSGVKTQREIAAEMGYEKPNIVSMYKRGEAKVPLDKIPAMAKALHVDPVLLFKMAIEQYWPKQEDAIRRIFGTLATERQAKWLEALKDITGEDDPELTDARRKALAECLGRAE